jgi:hypothetical protein
LAAATDERLGAEILSYSRSRGLFAGVSLDGSSIQLDYTSERAFYGPRRGRTPQPIPAPAAELIQKLAHYSGSPEVPPVSLSREDGPRPRSERVPPAAPPDDPEALRSQLAEAAIMLSAVLPDDWRRYLALPAEVYETQGHPRVERLRSVLDRFERVAGDNRYRGLSERREFQQAHAALRAYAAALAPESSPPLRLPPPPQEGGGR